jgi:tripartite-type tricarboxylate transporter receptor subunit TctC
MRLLQLRRAIAAMAMAQLLLLATGSAEARAANFPEPGRSITVLVPYAPGGSTDTSARLMAAALEPLLKTSVQVVNRPGAGSEVGLTQLVRARPDGYTLSYIVVPTVVTHYLDPARAAIYTRASFQPIGRHYISPAMLAVRSDSAYHTLKDLVEAARAHPGAITVSDSGLMAVPNLCTLMLAHAAGVQFAPVHFDGGAPSVMALLGSHVQVLAGGAIDSAPYKKTGEFRVLGMCDEQPDWSMPDVPTMRSQGYDVVAVSNTGMVAPAGTPPEVVAVLTDAMKTVLASPDHQQKIRALSNTPAYLDPAGYTQVWIDMERRVKPILATLRSQVGK